MPKTIGQLGETLAKEYLKKKGYVLLETNYTNRFGKKLGEIDIIAKEMDTIVFVEVKTRCQKAFSEVQPQENINKSKLIKCNKIANIYIKENNLWEKQWRFDAIAIVIDIDLRKARFDHLKDIFF